MNSSSYSEEMLYNCIKCKKELPLDLDSKILEIVGGSLLCDVCSKMHLPYNSSNEQLQISVEQNSLVCNISDKAFNAKVDLNLHAVEKVYSCGICSQTVSSNHDLCMHLQPLVNEKLSICEVCMKTFATRTELKRHLLTHSKGKPYVCTVCKKAFTRITYLKVHFRRHTGEKPYVCNVCKLAFAQQSELKLHFCCDSEEKPYKCGECSSAFAQPSYLKRHSRIHTEEKPFVCEVCDKAYKERVTLQQHMLFHTGERPFACHVCDRTYTRKSYLRNHMRYHTGEKPYVCDVCKATFTQRFQIVAHSCDGVTVRTEKTFRRGECTTIYVKSPTLTLRKPVRARAEEKYVTIDASEKAASQCGQVQPQKSYICGECKTAFVTAYDLKLHLRTHSEDKTFECDLCKKTFLKLTSLKLHRWRCHELDWNRLKYTKTKD